MRYAGHIAGGIKTVDGGARIVIDKYARGAMAGTEADFRDVHFYHLLAIIDAPARLEPPARRALHVVQRGFNFLDGFFVQVIEFEENRALATLQFVVELQHHLAAPVIAFDKPHTLIVRGVSTERSRDIGAGRAVIVLD